MEKRLTAVIKNLRLRQGASEAQLDETERKLNIVLPQDYREFMLQSDGAEGNVGPHSYLMLWPVEELVALNDAHNINEFAPGLILFGSDGGGTGYAFDTRTSSPAIVEVPFIGMSTESARRCSATFIGFLEYLHNR